MSKVKIVNWGKIVLQKQILWQHSSEIIIKIDEKNSTSGQIPWNLIYSQCHSVKKNNWMLKISPDFPAKDFTSAICVLRAFMHNWKRISDRPDHWIPFKSWFSYLIQKYFLIVQYDIHNPSCVPACFSIDHDRKDINLTFSLYCRAFPIIICNISHKNGKTISHKKW